MKHSFFLTSLLVVCVCACNTGKRTNNIQSNAEIISTVSDNDTSLRSDGAIAAQTDFDRVITEKYWKLIILNGKEITFASEGQNREAYFILKNDKNRVTGNTGCNNMNGSYSLSEEGNGIQFGPMATTRMACVGVDYETEYLNVFIACDRFTLKNDTLTLDKGETSLAKFVAVYLR